MDTRHSFLCSTLVLIFFPFASFSASLYTEVFFDTAAGWQNRPSGAMTVTNSLTIGNPGGCLQGTFGAQFGPPSPPFDGAFVATGALASASFVGDYEEVDAWLLGFDFMAGDIAPNNLRVYLYSGTNYIYRILDNLIIQTGEWYSIKLPLLYPLASGWTNDNPVAVNVLTNITRVEINVVRNNVNAQSYYLDNLFLDRLPDAVQMTATNMVWLHFRSNSDYRLEASTNLTTSAWTPLETFTATTSVYNVKIIETNETVFYRFQME